MVRRKKRYLLLYSNYPLTKHKCKSMNLLLIERGNYPIVRCYLLDLDQVKARLANEGIEILSISGTLKSLRERKEQIVIQR